MFDRPFIIWALDFDENIGGRIALHYLCHKLNKLGHHAYLWPNRRPNYGGENFHAHSHPVIRTYNSAKDKLKKAYVDRVFKRNEFMYSQFAERDLIADAVVLYPEIVSGNPLGAKRVVRWFLNKPGDRTGEVNFGPGELYFFYQQYFDDPSINPHPSNLLRLRWIRSDIYKKTNFGERTGACYMVKKGRDRMDIDIPDGAMLIDGRSHEEISAIFNQKKYFFCYDLYTMYCVYASMCGCIPVVIPKASVTKEQWRPDASDRYGIAYGTDDVEWAIETRMKLFEKLKNEEILEDQLAQEFVAKCRNFFD